jgi:hypothetical protein
VVLVTVVVETAVVVAKVVVLLVADTELLMLVLVGVAVWDPVVPVNVRLFEVVVAEVPVLVTRAITGSCTRVQASVALGPWPEAAWRVSIGLWQMWKISPMQSKSWTTEQLGSRSHLRCASCR